MTTMASFDALLTSYKRAPLASHNAREPQAVGASAKRCPPVAAYPVHTIETISCGTCGLVVVSGRQRLPIALI